MKNIFDSQEFRKTMKPFLSHKKTVFSQISIETNNKNLSDNFYLSDKFRTLRILSDHLMSSQMNII